MSEDMKQPKFRFGQKVKVKGACLPIYTFIVKGIRFRRGEFVYFSDEQDTDYFPEDQLTEVKELLRAEFECEWITVAPGMVTPVSFDRSYIVSAILKKFKGKRTKVILEELP